MNLSLFVFLQKTLHFMFMYHVRLKMSRLIFVGPSFEIIPFELGKRKYICRGRFSKTKTKIKKTDCGVSWQ